jgi:hypothetical protein
LVKYTTNLRGFNWIEATEFFNFTTQRGAHLLLQVRTHVFNEDLREIFGRWYPGDAVRHESVAERGVAPTL